ncbi:Brain-enriched guanylate kinase-associated protein [Nymphon striatum]|nr:Brain-enriched guanylate kinase-associated protein [Nymphon striatum]
MKDTSKISKHMSEGAWKFANLASMNVGASVIPVSTITGILHLHTEIESLKCQLVDKEYHILQMETNFLTDAQRYPSEHQAVRDEVQFWQDKYDRLFESHKKMQKVNQGLEDKLLRIVDKFETEKAALTTDVADLTTKLIETRVNLSELEEENDQYRHDCNIAVQLLQCKPSNFVSHKLSTFVVLKDLVLSSFFQLPSDFQSKVKDHISVNDRKGGRTVNNVPHEPKVIRVPIPTFPPTAMVYSVNGHDESESNNIPKKPVQPHPDVVSAAIMAKVLEERAKERNSKGSVYVCKYCRNQRKRNSSSDYCDKGTQTDWWSNGSSNSSSRDRRLSNCDSSSICSSCSSKSLCDSSTNTVYYPPRKNKMLVRSGSSNSTETAI